MDTAADLALHLRLLAGDVLAPADCVERWLPELIRRLAQSFTALAGQDEHFIIAAANEALLNYLDAPERYNPQLAALSTYLFQSARGDLLNAQQRERRQRRDATYIGPVELRSLAGNNFEEQAIARVDAAAAWQIVLADFPDLRDRRLLKLYLGNERSSAAYAKILGLENEPELEQRKIVKRHKDRIAKRLARLKGVIE